MTTQFSPVYIKANMMKPNATAYSPNQHIRLLQSLLLYYKV